MLKTTQSISLSGSSVIDGTAVASFSTTLAADQSYSNIATQIINIDLYNANKSEIRADRNTFQEKADSIVDGLESDEAPQDTE